MRPLLPPAMLGALPVGQGHGHTSPTEVLTANGYDFRAVGNFPNARRVWSYPTPDEASSVDGFGFVYGYGKVADPSVQLTIELPFPMVIAGISVTSCLAVFPDGTPENVPPNAWQQIKTEGLDKSSDPNGVWRLLRSSFTLQVPSSGMSAGWASAPQVIVSTEAPFFAEAIRLSPASYTPVLGDGNFSRYRAGMLLGSIVSIF
jgi:hypothetical protein